MIHVDVRGTDDAAFQRAMGEFKKRVKKSEIMLELRKYEGFTKPGQKLRLKRVEALKRRRREERDSHRPNRSNRP